MRTTSSPVWVADTGSSGSAPRVCPPDPVAAVGKSPPPESGFLRPLAVPLGEAKIGLMRQSGRCGASCPWAGRNLYWQFVLRRVCSAGREHKLGIVRPADRVVRTLGWARAYPNGEARSSGKVPTACRLDCPRATAIVLIYIFLLSLSRFYL